ncbi:MAG: hypothetical protein KBC91_06775 [Candidatus Omnitrophica bacterium]|nr:hypothetical protein [Candidatus Omnitrophota bacterium]
MIRRISWMLLLFSSLFAARGWAGNCRQFVSDFRENKIVSSKAYQFESDQLYLPAQYCAFSPFNFVSSEDSRAEFYLIEQCRETGYKILKTTLMCLEDPQAAKVRSSCDVNGHLLSPCTKNQLTEALAQTEPA